MLRRPAKNFARGLAVWLVNRQTREIFRCGCRAGGFWSAPATSVSGEPGADVRVSPRE